MRAELARAFAETRQQMAALPRRRTVPPLTEFARRHLGTYFPTPASDFHRWLTTRLDALTAERGQRVNALAPRGAAKSTWATFAFPLRQALYGLSPYTILSADTASQAEKYLDAIRFELETNESILSEFPDVAGQGPIWRQDQLRLNNGCMVEAVGTGSKMRGRRNRDSRPSLIVVDDPQNTEHVVSPVQRERTWDWLVRDVCNAGSPDTNYVVLGTALHREAIVCRLQQTPGWVSTVFKSVIAWPNRMDIWREWEEILHDWNDQHRDAHALAYYQTNRDAMDRGHEVLWPERESLYDLMKLRATIGAVAFESEKQNNPVNPELCEWPESYFDWPGFWFDEWPEVLDLRVLALDPSKGKDAQRGDYSAWVRYGRAMNGVEYVEADLRRRSVEEIVGAGVAHVRDFQPDAVVVEANAFQELLIAPMLAAFRAAKLEPRIVPIVNTTNKGVRIRRLGSPLSQKRLRFRRRSPGTQLLVQQARDFPIGDHDDGIDALEMARRHAIEMVNGKRRGQ